MKKIQSGILEEDTKIHTKPSVNRGRGDASPTLSSYFKKEGNGAPRRAKNRKGRTGPKKSVQQVVESLVDEDAGASSEEDRREIDRSKAIEDGKEALEVKQTLKDHKDLLQRLSNMSNDEDLLDDEILELSRDHKAQEFLRSLKARIDSELDRAEQERSFRTIELEAQRKTHKRMVEEAEGERLVSDIHDKDIFWRSDLYTNLMCTALTLICSYLCLNLAGMSVALFLSPALSIFLFVTCVPFLAYLVCVLMSRFGIAGIYWSVRIDKQAYRVSQGDLRPESMSSVGIKYRDANILFHSKRLYFTIWNTKVFKIWTWYGYHSNELLSHLNAINLNFVHADEEVVKKKKAMFIENFHSLNIPRDTFLFGNLGRQTAFLSHGMWCADRQSSAHMDF